MTPKDQAEEHANNTLAVVNEELSVLGGWEIEDDEDNTLAGEMLADVKGRIKALEKKRKAITVPLTQAKKEVDDLFRPPRTALEEAERLLKVKIAGYLEEQQEANVAALEATGAATSAEEASAALATVKHVEAPAGVSVRHRYVPVVVAEDLLMPQFLSPDLDKIKAWAKIHVGADGAPKPIPGVRFDKVPVVSSRSN